MTPLNDPPAESTPAAMLKPAGASPLHDRLTDLYRPAGAALIDLLVEVRHYLRTIGHYAADMIRVRLAALGITLRDGREQTTWHRD